MNQDDPSEGTKKDGEESDKPALPEGVKPPANEPHVAPPQTVIPPPKPPKTFGSDSGGKDQRTEKQSCKEISVSIRKDRSLSNFESRSLKLNWVTLFVLFLTFIVFYCQLSVSHKQFIDAETDARSGRRHAREQLRILESQTYAAQAQVKAVTQQMQTDGRPWIGVDRERNNSTMAEKRSLNYELTLNAYGKTPAKKVHIISCVDVVKTGEGPRFIHYSFPCTEVKGGLFLPGLSHNIPTYRGVPGVQPMKDDPVTSTEEMELIQGHAWVAVHGIVTYQDIFSVNHWTKFCYEYNFAPFATKLSSLSCADYNDVDGEYQKQQSK